MVRAVERCEPCQGTGVVSGIFHRMECAGCNGGGVVDAATHASLAYPDLVAWLRDELARARKGARPALGEVGRRNRGGAGGGHWTGD